jgi:RNA recognition motif-containing protein
MNLTNDVTEEQIRQLCNAKDIFINRIDIVKALDKKKTAYVLVELNSPKQAQLLKDRLKGKWIADKQLKVRTSGEEYLETFDNRTVIVSGISRTYTEKDLIDLFEDFGAVVGVELPKYDLFIQHKLDNKESVYNKEKKQQDLKDYRRAQEIIEKSYKVDENYQAYL